MRTVPWESRRGWRRANLRATGHLATRVWGCVGWLDNGLMAPSSCLCIEILALSSFSVACPQHMKGMGCCLFWKTTPWVKSCVMGNACETDNCINTHSLPKWAWLGLSDRPAMPRRAPSWGNRPGLWDQGSYRGWSSLWAGAQLPLSL
jgi:hypothetical protein